MKRRRNPSRTTIIAGVIGVAAVGAIAWYFLKKKSTPSVVSYPSVAQQVAPTTAAAAQPSAIQSLIGQGTNWLTAQL